LHDHERVLAGALRFAVDRPADEAKLLAPLAKSLKRYRSKSHDGSDWAANPESAAHDRG